MTGGANHLPGHPEQSRENSTTQKKSVVPFDNEHEKHIKEKATLRQKRSEPTPEAAVVPYGKPQRTGDPSLQCHAPSIHKKEVGLLRSCSSVPVYLIERMRPD